MRLQHMLTQNFFLAALLFQYPAVTLRTCGSATDMRLLTRIMTHDVFFAALSFSDSSFKLKTYDYETISHNQQKAYCFQVNSSGTQFRASLVWTDPAGNPYGDAFLVNDLDLTVVDSSGAFFYGNGWRATTEVGA